MSVRACVRVSGRNLPVPGIIQETICAGRRPVSSTRTNCPERRKRVGESLDGVCDAQPVNRRGDAEGGCVDHHSPRPTEIRSDWRMRSNGLRKRRPFTRPYGTLNAAVAGRDHRARAEVARRRKVRRSTNDRPPSLAPSPGRRSYRPAPARVCPIPRRNPSPRGRIGAIRSPRVQMDSGYVERSVPRIGGAMTAAAARASRINRSRPWAAARP